MKPKSKPKAKTRLLVVPKGDPDKELREAAEYAEQLDAEAFDRWVNGLGPEER